MPKLSGESISVYSNVKGYNVDVTTTSTLGSTLNTALSGVVAGLCRIINTSANTVYYGSTSTTADMVTLATGAERVVPIAKPGDLYFDADSNSTIEIEVYS